MTELPTNYSFQNHIYGPIYIFVTITQPPPLQSGEIPNHLAELPTNISLSLNKKPLFHLHYKLSVFTSNLFLVFLLYFYFFRLLEEGIRLGRKVMETSAIKPFIKKV